ncbi:MAG: hypothetical protein PHQ58_20800 [Rhodoferax sp.]|uniref:hypothetical protein n=1 Tax=Rhodoferax sp. TaxID=50421 RepID=UPI0026296D84|nr:hypothetical protein [Rhodoferax sp.]MDD2882858.1 hypothetical protein [Rhodoferax sp.]
MNISELLGFIAPQLEPLQLSFFILILVMFFGTIFSTLLNAKDAAWEKNWNNGTPDDYSDDLDIDHGSVTDLWHAVATKSEKLAEIMPGMLLVVGLLGTFLGLGLALNHASNILGQSNAISATGTANSMQDLLSMMQGLGTKFKTSTWGIAFFLLLKVWSSWLGFEEKRLTWVIRKVKAELERRKAQAQATELNKQQTLFAQINQAAGQIVQGFSLNLEKLSESQKAHHQQTLQFLGKGIQTVRGDLASINTAIQSDNAIMKQVLEQSIQGVRADLASINAATQASSEAMAGFVNSTQTIIKDMSAASNKMADGAHEVGVAGSSLVKAVDEFSTQFKQVLGDVRTDLSAAINDMSEQAARTLEQGTKELGKATLEISAALGVLSQDVTVTMNGVKDSIGKSLKIQEEGAVLFRRSSDTLNENVTATTELVQKLGEDIRSGLQAVSDSGRRMVSIGKSLETIVPQMGDLLPALEPLKTLHAQNQPLLDEAKTLRTDLSKRDARQEIQFEKSLKIQIEVAERIQRSTDMLNEHVKATTALVQKLGDDTLRHLKTVSDTDHRIKSSAETQS